jgi:hypothetical protein
MADMSPLYEVPPTQSLQGLREGRERQLSSRHKVQISISLLPSQLSMQPSTDNSCLLHQNLSFKETEKGSPRVSLEYNVYIEKKPWSLSYPREEGKRLTGQERDPLAPADYRLVCTSFPTLAPFMPISPVLLLLSCLSYLSRLRKTRSMSLHYLASCISYVSP